MEELRSQIRAAFEKEQMAHPPAPALRRQVVAAVTAQPLREAKLQWVAVAAAVLIGALVVGGLMAARLAHHAPVPASPLADYGPPPPGVPLLFIVDPRDYQRLQGFDWLGKPRGTVKVTNIPNEQGHRFEMTPDGSAFKLDADGRGGAVYLDRLGNVIQGPVEVGALWADDNRHQCSVTFDSRASVWRFGTQLPGQAVRLTAVIAGDGQDPIDVVACSFHNDRSILVRNSVASPSDVWVVKLSTGQVLSHHTVAGRLVGTIVGSPDAAYVAESSAKASPSNSASGAGSTIIRRVSDWTVAGSLDPSAQVLGFSGDDSHVLVNYSPDNPYLLPAHLVIEAWGLGCPSTGGCYMLSLWSYNGPEALGSFAAQPGGPDFVLALKSPPRTVPSSCVNTVCQVFDEPLRDIVIVHGDESTTRIPGRFIPAW
jgi:peptidoglycan hydrolase-like protein with peptidoglycan-binding domain